MNPYLLSALEALLTGVAVGLGSVATASPPRDWESALIAGVIAATGVMLSSLRSLRSAAPGHVQVPVEQAGQNRKDPAAERPERPSSSYRPFLAALLCAGVTLLSACAATEAQTPAQRLYAVQSGYAAAVNEAAAYEARPRCTADGADPAWCSDPQTVAALRRSDTAMYATLQAAKQAPTDASVTAAEAALRALRASLTEIAR